MAWSCLTNEYFWSFWTSLLNLWPPPFFFLSFSFFLVIYCLWVNQCPHPCSAYHSCHCHCPCSCYCSPNPQLILLSVLPALILCFSSIMMTHLSITLALHSSPTSFSPFVTICHYHCILFGCRPFGPLYSSHSFHPSCLLLSPVSPFLDCCFPSLLHIPHLHQLLHSSPLFFLHLIC